MDLSKKIDGAKKKGSSFGVSYAPSQPRTLMYHAELLASPVGMARFWVEKGSRKHRKNTSFVLRNQGFSPGP